MNWKQFLTEKVLNGCWHKRVQVGDMLNMRSECSCGKPDYLGTANDHINRTFDNDADMMALFRVSYKNGEWKDLEEHLFNYWDDMFPHQKTAMGTFTAWLFCLDGKGYEDRCCLVAQWLMEVKK